MISVLLGRGLYSSIPDPENDIFDGFSQPHREEQSRKISSPWILQALPTRLALVIVSCVFLYWTISNFPSESAFQTKALGIVSAPGPIIQYSFEPNTVVNDSTVINVVSSSYAAQLMGGASVVTSESGVGSGCLRLVNCPGCVEYRVSFQYLQVPSLPWTLPSTVNSGLTFSCWFRSNNNPTWARIFDFGEGVASNNIIAYINQGNLGIACFLGSSNSGNQYDNVYPDVNDNTWHHFVWVISPERNSYSKKTYQTSTWYVYVDGQLVQQYSRQNIPATVSRPNSYIGKSNWDGDPYFDGAIDEFRMYTTALSDADIQVLYVATISPTGVPSTIIPTAIPSTTHPSPVPSTLQPTTLPSTFPILQPTTLPSTFPTLQPTALPSAVPSTIKPSPIPSLTPTRPTVVPSNGPTNSPTLNELVIYYSFESLPNYSFGPVANLGNGGAAINGQIVNTGAYVVNTNCRVGSGCLKLFNNVGLVSSFSYMQVPTFTIGNSGLTFACWLNYFYNPKSARLFDFGNGVTSDNLFAYIVGNGIGIGVYYGATRTHTQYDSVVTNVNDLSWHHFAWTLATDGTWTVYGDGQKKWSMTGKTYPNAIARSSNFIGKSNWASDPYFTGGIDDFRVYNKVLRPSEILALSRAS